MFYYQTETGNYHLRRYAEAIRNHISEFAELMNIPGDLATLATQINYRLKAEGLPTLTDKQKSWCSSFNQENPTRPSTFARVSVLLLFRSPLVSFSFRFP